MHSATDAHFNHAKRLSRADLADIMLTTASNDTLIGRVVTVSN